MSREKILNAIKKFKPAETALPEPFTAASPIVDRTGKYLEVLQSIGGKGSLVNGLNEVDALLQQYLSSGASVVNCIETLPHYNADECLSKSPVELESVQAVFIKASFAVAENAAIWVAEKNTVSRLLPFICQELILVVEESGIVANMHEAYEKISVDEDGFGTFIAGPSKTADIEQSLVIGAHGPLSLQVFVLR